MESRPSWEPNLSIPWLFGRFRPTIRSTKIASTASQGHRDPPRSPQEDRPKKKIKKNWAQFLESRPSWEPNPLIPWLSAGFGPTIRSTKIASTASQGHREPTRSPQEDRPKRNFCNFFLAAVGRKVGPLGELFGRLPGWLGALPPMFDQQIMPPEPPGTYGSPWGAQKKKLFGPAGA